MTLCIVQARMGSTRLPGKIMRDILGKPVIWHVIERLKKSRCIDKLVVATSVNQENDVFCEYLKKNGVEFYRGKEDDVLDRFYQAAIQYHPKCVVRITADCPLIDAELVDKVLEYFLMNDFDYVSNVHPRRYPHGLDTEVFSFESLKKAWKEATLLAEREHVTPYIINSGKFERGSVISESDYSTERWTLDYEDDFTLIARIYELLYKKTPYFNMYDILNCKKNHPEIFKINEHRKIYGNPS